MATPVRWASARWPFRLVLALLSACGLEASAATFVVSTTADTADGACDGHCSLREAVVAANETPGPDVIQLPAGVYGLTRGGADSFAATGDLDVRDDLQIVGAGALLTAIDASGLAPRDRLVELDPCTAPGVCPGPSTVSITGVTLRGGRAAFGGAVFVPAGSTLQLAGARIEQSEAENGGGLLVQGAATITDSTLDGNAAVTTGSPSNGFGGGLFVGPGGTVSLLDATVSGNSASRDGAGSFAAGDLSVSGGAFTGNQAGGVGGAIQGSGLLSVVGARIAGNTADDGGGVAYLGSASATLSGVTVEDNVAAGTTSLGGGGGLFLFSGAMTVEESTIAANTAFGEGGGGLLSSGSLSIQDTTFDGNRAVLHAGPLPPTTNAPGFGGGMLLIEGGSASLLRVELRDNEAGKSGGAIYQDRDSTMVVSGSTFTGNEASGFFGGAILNEGDLSLSATTLHGNFAGQNGGAVSTAVGTATIASTVLEANQAGIGGGAVYHFGADGGALSLADSHLLGNRAGSLGGGLLNEGTATVTGGSITGNEATQTGGGVYNASGATLELEGTRIADNVSMTANGGGVWNEGGLDADRVVVEGNEAVAAGSGIGGGLANRIGQLRLVRSTVHANRAQAAAGIFNFDGGLLTLEESTISGNTALGPFGGGLQNQATAVLRNVTVSGNLASTAGAGLASVLGGTTSMTHVTFAENVAAIGDAVYAFQGSVILANSLVAGRCELQGTLVSEGGNLEGPGDTCFPDEGPDLRGVAAVGLGSLAANGGATSTHLLLPESPAIGAALPSACLPNDQRGVPRAPGGGDAGCDVGAVELPEPGPAAALLALGTLLPLRARRAAAAGRSSGQPLSEPPRS